MNSFENITDSINDLLDKHHAFQTNFIQEVNECIANKTYEVTGVRVGTREDISKLQKDYCMYLFIVELSDLNPSKYNIVLKRGFDFFIETPKPDELVVHTMERGAMLKKDEEGMWKAI